MENSQARWSDLPTQLWPLIGEHLDTYIDVLRFRSVCRSWRASLPKLNAISPVTKNQDALSTLSFLSGWDKTVVFQRIIYRFTPIVHHRSSSSGWLAMIETTNLRRIRFHRPIYLYSDESRNKSALRNEVNFLDFRIEEVAKSYFLGLTNTDVPARKKVVVVFPEPNCIIVAIQHQRKLVFTKHGDTDTCWIGEKNSEYHDVIMYKGRIYTVDRDGIVFSIDSSMELVQFSPPLRVCSDQKYLVECGGELYVVDRFVEWELDLLNSDRFDRRLIPAAKSFDFKVHRLDQERGRWVEVKNLGNQALVLGMGCCFWITASDFEGFEENCIYFSHELNSDHDEDDYRSDVFELEKGMVMKSSAEIIRAPPVWLDWEASNIQSAYKLNDT